MQIYNNFAYSKIHFILFLQGNGGFHRAGKAVCSKRTRIAQIFADNTINRNLVE